MKTNSILLMGLTLFVASSACAGLVCKPNEYCPGTNNPSPRTTQTQQTREASRASGDVDASDCVSGSEVTEMECEAQGGNWQSYVVLDGRGGSVRKCDCFPD